MSLNAPDSTLFVELVCKLCGLAYSAYAPPYDEIAFPVCATCREAPEEGCARLKEN